MSFSMNNFEIRIVLILLNLINLFFSKVKDYDYLAYSTCVQDTGLFPATLL